MLQMTRQDRQGVLEYYAVYVQGGKSVCVCVRRGVRVGGGSWVRCRERMGEEGRVKCREEREDRQRV